MCNSLLGSNPTLESLIHSLIFKYTISCALNICPLIIQWERWRNSINDKIRSYLRCVLLSPCGKVNVKGLSNFPNRKRGHFLAALYTKGPQRSIDEQVDFLFATYPERRFRGLLVATHNTGYNGPICSIGVRLEKPARCCPAIQSKSDCQSFYG